MEDCAELFTKLLRCVPIPNLPDTEALLYMARLPKDVLITTQPVRVFPNEDYLYVEISRANVHYDCRMKMARKGDPSKSLDVARAQGKTMREAENRCYERAIERFPRLPGPPYSKKGSGASRTLLKASQTGT